MDESESGQMVSMTNNVKSCKKINGRAQTFRFSVFPMGRQELFAKIDENIDVIHIREG